MPTIQGSGTLTFGLENPEPDLEVFLVCGKSIEVRNPYDAISNYFGIDSFVTNYGGIFHDTASAIGAAQITIQDVTEAFQQLNNDLTVSFSASGLFTVA